MKKLWVVLLSVGLLLAACGNEATADDDKTIVVGFGVGTYEEQFRTSILPILEEKGYDVKMEVFSQNMQLNPAMQEGSIDASVFQSTAYMEGINEELGMEMTPIAYVPGAPQSLHSAKHDSLDAVEDGTTVALPNDPVNQERAVRILEDLGWVKVASDAGTTDFNLNSVEPDQYDIAFEVLDPAQILVALEDVDFGVINGNYIADAGMKITDALKIEDTPLEHRIIVTTLAEDAESEWAEDLTAAYESAEFEAYILSEEKYDGFILPEAWENN
ncbi:D-methionine transport system substrate-binding protein [Streptohalobacillus salinus]|uniref:D-methionine transport system substrate-binding protein n=1 Tax=Streptohalobacillus salinus TaxID=621096 RepID=A0A2V3W2C5_9BACI|nr:MetQ/NlpA family ABC transporter substrate-binding protein [Streptohalobacillus salinus]PXW88493.1 D-methionine transport system substrate-binding protein [Streptohalobacillus salinus]